MEKIKKLVTIHWNKPAYLLGIGKDDQRYYLIKPSWDCDWYWGFGYVQNKDMHTHFDSLFFKNNVNSFEAFKDFFKASTLTDDELWKLLDYMHTFYTLKETAEVYGRGYSHFTEKAKLENLKRTDLVELINKKQLPELFEQIDHLLNPEYKEIIKRPENKLTIRTKDGIIKV